MSRGGTQRIYPRSGRILLDGGLNNKFERSIIEDNESPDCANVVFKNGAVETREGVSKLNTAAVGSFVIDGIYTRRSNTGAETMVVFAGGSGWQLAGTSFSTIGSAQSVFTAGVRVAATQYENHLFVGNGGVVPYKYNGTDWTRHGVYPPTTTATVASNGVGALTASGDYRYKIAFVNTALVESDVGPVSTTFTISTTSGQNRLTSIPVAPQSWGVSTRNIYRTVASGTTFLRVGTISDNTTTTYDDNVADASLGVEAPSDHGVPPNYSICCYHQNRLFVNDPSIPNGVFYSDLNEPYTFGALSFVLVGDGAADLVKGLSVYENSVLVTCEKSLWLIYMPSTDPADWKTQRIRTAFGSKSPFCLLDINNKHLFAAVQNGKFAGMAAVNGETVDTSTSFLTVSAAGSELLTDRIEPDMFLVQETYLPNISGIVYQNKAYIAVTYGAAQTTNNRIYQMDFSISNLKKRQTESWVPFTGLSASQFTIYGGNLYYGSSLADGFVYQMETGDYNDDGEAIDSYFWTKEFSGYESDVNFHKDFRYANILVEMVGAYYMDVVYRTNSDRGSGTTDQISLDPGGSLWGVMEWEETWGGGNSQEDVQLDLGSANGKRIQLKFTNQNTADQRFKVHGLNFTYNLKGQR